MKQEGKFTLKKKTSFAEMQQTESHTLCESDLTLQDGVNVYQYKFESGEDGGNKIEISSGTYIIGQNSCGVYLTKMEFKKRNLLESITSTAAMMNEANTFFSRLHIYEKRNRPKKRGVLIYSTPGLGKTSAIEKVCTDLIEQDAGTVVLVWPTSQIEADDIAKFLSVSSEYKSECTRLVLIIEDIGGGENERHRSNSGVDSGLLNLLDGVGVTFRLPTFIMATTNNPAGLLSSLANRPGRFDKLIKLSPPKYDERVQLMEFISGRPMTEDEKAALKYKEADNFSIAHLEEIDVRSELHDKTYLQVIKELIAHNELFESDFEDPKMKMGFGN